jgi:putative transposase
MSACGCLNAAGASASAPRPHRAVADAPNAVWAVDLQFDATTDGRPVKIVSIVDEHTRECLGGLVERNITSDDLIVELDRPAALRAIQPCCAGTTAPNSSALRWPTGQANAPASTSTCCGHWRRRAW